MGVRVFKDEDDGKDGGVDEEIRARKATRYRKSLLRSHWPRCVARAAWPGWEPTAKTPEDNSNSLSPREKMLISPTSHRDRGKKVRPCKRACTEQSLFCLIVGRNTDFESAVATCSFSLRFLYDAKHGSTAPSASSINSRA
jgi:hypothetical protein